MKRLIITHVGGELDFTLPDIGDLPSAVSRQEASYPLAMEDNSIIYLNTRHVVAWTVEDADESESDESEDSRTVAELKDALDTAKVEYDSKALKAELLELAKQNNV